MTEWSNVPGMLAGVYPAPASLAAADSPQMTNPLDCGSPLYPFFAGIDGYDKLVDDLARGAALWPDRRTSTATNASPSSSTVFGSVGQVAAVISIKAKLVRKLTYDAANLVAKGRATETESAPSSGAPPFHKSLPQSPSKLTVTEIYHDDTSKAKLADSTAIRN